MLDITQLVNAAHPCQSRPLLGELCSVGGGVCLARPAAEALQALLAELHAEAQIVPVSGWRAHAEQQALWDDTLQASGPEFTQSYVAKPGCSEHETGLAIDLGYNDGQPLDFIRPNFPYDGVCGQFRSRAAAYGFVERYPAGRENVTGIAHEPWHFRYVGPQLAAALTQSGQTLEEWYAHNV